jgi:hypothetical protein
MASYADVLLKPAVKAVVLLAFAAMLGLNVLGWTKTTSGFELIDLVPDQSYVRDIIDLTTRMIGSPTGDVPFQVYTKALPYHEADTQASYADLHAALAASPKVAAVESWYTAFTEWLGASAYAGELDGAGRLTAAASFYPALRAFLDHEVAPGVRLNRRYASDIIWVDEAAPLSGMTAARFGGRHPTAVADISERQVECLEVEHLIYI